MALLLAHIGQKSFNLELSVILVNYNEVNSENFPNVSFKKRHCFYYFDETFYYRGELVSSNIFEDNSAAGMVVIGNIIVKVVPTPVLLETRICPP